MIQTGFPSLDKLIHGFEEGKLYVIADKEPLANSVIGTNLAYKMAIEKHHSMLYFSMSCNNAQMITRLLSIKSGISKEQLKEGTLEQSQWKGLDNDIRFMADSNLYIDDTLPFEIEEVYKKIKALKGENRLEIVIIDGFSVDAKSRSAAIHALKTLATELKIPIVIITKYSQGTFNFTEQSLQWKKSVLDDVDSLMFVQPPLRGSLASIMNIPIWAIHSPVCMPANLYVLHVVKIHGYESGNVCLTMDYGISKLKDSCSL